MAHPETEAAPSHDIDSAASAIDDILNPQPADDTGDTPDDAPEPSEDEPEGNEPEGEADEPEAEDEPDAPVIAPPVSWTADDKAMFATLPPTAQAVIAKRESERDRIVQSKATEAAEAKRAAAHAEAAIGQLNQTYATRLQQFLQSNTVAEPDEALLESDPVEYLRQERAARAAHAQRAEAQQHIEAVNAWQTQQDADARNATLAEQQAILVERVPEWSDDAARTKLIADIHGLASAHGFPAERLDAADAADIIFLRDVVAMKAKADKFDKLVADKMTVVRAAKDLPRVAKPGTASPKGAGAAERLNAARENFGKSGNLDSAAALIRSMGLV